jgi:hypothetical protein
MMVDEIGSGLNQVIAVCAAVPTFSGRSISIKRCVDRANSRFCIDILATACFRNRIGAVFEVQKSRAFNSDVTSPLPECDRLAQDPSRQQQAR